MTKSPLLLCATDAGGARNLAPVARLARQRGHAVSVQASRSTAALFAELGVEASLDTPTDPTEAAALLSRLKPAALLCGTTRYVQAEAHLITAAPSLAIPSLSVLDEWYGYRGRFCSTDETLDLLPDLICCPDVLAVAEAEAEGLPRARLRATGSPALATLADRTVAFAAAPPPVPEQWRHTAGTRVLFLSETHAVDYGNAPGEVGPLGPFIGYTEHVVRRHLAETLGRIGTNVAVVEKCHPAATEIPAPPAIGAGVWVTVTQAALWPLLFHAEVVIGMRSMALLEAAMMGHRPLSYQPDLIGAQRCTAARQGLADTADSPETLEAWLHRALLKRFARLAPARPPFAAIDAASNILALSLGD